MIKTKFGEIQKLMKVSQIDHIILNEKYVLYKNIMIDILEDLKDLDNIKDIDVVIDDSKLNYSNEIMDYSYNSNLSVLTLYTI